jgi:hypothetical protein
MIMTGTVNATPTRAIRKTVPMSPKRTMKKASVSRYLRLVGLIGDCRVSVDAEDFL